jgi:ribosomal protein S27E
MPRHVERALRNGVWRRLPAAPAPWIHPREVSMPMTAFIDPGPRYFVVECAGCGKHIALGQAPTPDEHSPMKSFELQVTCPHCRSNRTYSPAQVSRRYGNGEQGLSLLD